MKIQLFRCVWVLQVPWESIAAEQAEKKVVARRALLIHEICLFTYQKGRRGPKMKATLAESLAIRLETMCVN